MKHKLTKVEKKETVFQTVGILKAAIEYGHSKERQLLLLEQISSKVGEMDITILHLEREVKI